MEYKRILVPVNGDETDEEAIKLACQLSERGKGEILAVYVIQVKRSLPLDIKIESETEQGERILERAEKVAKKQNREIETEILQARDVGAAVVEEAIDRNIDLIILGVEYKRKFGEYSLGEVIPYVLKHAPCAVVVLRTPMRSGEH